MTHLIDFNPPAIDNVIPAHYGAGNPVINKPEILELFLRSRWQHISQRESFYAIFLNQALKPIAWSKIADGGIDSVLMDVRILFKYAIDCMATGIVIAHNHPSGKLTPSAADDKLTNVVRTGGEILHIRLVDHIILAPESGYFSYAESALI
jgi:DNA repair protein RadC